MGEAPGAVNDVSGGGTFAAMKTLDGGADTLLFPTEPPARSALRTERLQALQEAGQPLLSMFEHVEQLALAALRHDRHGAECLIDHRVVRGAVRHEGDTRRQQHVDDNEREAELIPERQSHDTPKGAAPESGAAPWLHAEGVLARDAPDVTPGLMLTPESRSPQPQQAIDPARVVQCAPDMPLVRRVVAIVFMTLAVNACAGARQSAGEGAVDRPLPGSQPARSEHRIAFTILEDYDKGDDLADIRRDFALFRELGITTWRGSLGWDDFEPSRGQYHFEWLHRFADAAEQDGITLRPYLAYTPAWAAAGGKDRDSWNDPPAQLDEWGAFVRQIATALTRHPNVRSLEIYNEENDPQWWEGTTAQYRAVLERASREIRGVNRDFDVLLGGMVYPDVQWLEKICDNSGGRLFDVLSFHAYPETWTPPDVDLERYLGEGFGSDFVQAADAVCGARPIWINETGFATTANITEVAQADWWARAIATFAAEPRIDGIGVYEIKDRAADRQSTDGAPNYHLGITRSDRTKKLAFNTVQTMAALLGRGPFELQPTSVVAASGEGELFVHGFRLDNRHQLVAAWTKRAPITVDLALASRGSRATERLLDGRTEPFPSFDGEVLREMALVPGTVRLIDVEP